MIHPTVEKSPFSPDGSHQVQDTFLMNSFDIEKIENYLEARETSFPNQNIQYSGTYVNEPRPTDFYLPLKTPGATKNLPPKMQESFSLLGKFLTTRTDRSAAGINLYTHLEGRLEGNDNTIPLNEAVVEKEGVENPDDTALLAELERVLKDFEGNDHDMNQISAIEGYNKICSGAMSMESRPDSVIMKSSKGNTTRKQTQQDKIKVISRNSPGNAIHIENQGDVWNQQAPQGAEQDRVEEKPEIKQVKGKTKHCQIF